MGILSTTPLDFKLDPADDDLYIGPNGPEFVYGPEGVAQLIKIAIRLRAGEWFMNLDAGVKWHKVLGEKWDDALEAFLRSQLIAAVARVPGYVETSSMDISFDGATRGVSVTWEVRIAFDDIGEQTIFGTTTVGGTNG